MNTEFSTIDIKTEDIEAVIALAEKSGLFDNEGVERIRLTLNAHLKEPDHEIWLMARDDGPAGIVYCAPEAMTDGTWNMLMLLVGPDKHGRGIGRSLVDALLVRLKKKGARLLIVETSGTPDFAGTRKFYERIGFTEEGRVRDFYTAGDDKVILSRTVS